MILLNNAAFVRFAKLLGREDDAVVKRCKEQLAKYDPVQVGESGQIKEYREERFYGDFVREKHHRHISHLVGLYPGAIMNRTTPDWLKAASRTLDLRGEVTEAWALLHRMCCRARTGEGDAAVRLFGNLMEVKTADTLWSIAHGVHIIDANYAGAAAFARWLGSRLRVARRETCQGRAEARPARRTETSCTLSGKALCVTAETKLSQLQNSSLIDARSLLSLKILLPDWTAARKCGILTPCFNLGNGFF